MAWNDPTSDRETSEPAKVKCAYECCVCAVEPGHKYCCNYCEYAAIDKEIEIQCDCKHSPCAL